MTPKEIISACNKQENTPKKIFKLIINIKLNSRLTVVTREHDSSSVSDAIS